MSWYRTGTVTVATGSKNVTGVGTLWASSVNVGDAFALVDANGNPTGAWYEVETVTSNTALVLKQTYTGTPAPGSNKQYAVFNLVGNMTTPSFAQRLAQFFDQFQNLVDLPTTTPTASSIPIADSGGKIDSAWIKDATSAVKGVVELATNEETQTGTDTVRAVTPGGLAAWPRAGSVSVTVGPSGADYTTLNAAITALVRRYPGHGATAIISVAENFVMAEQITVSGQNLGWIVITGSNADTPRTIAGSAIVQNISSSGTKAAFMAIYGGVLPYMGLAFQMDATGGTDLIGLSTSYGGYAVTTRGIRNVRGIGVSISTGGRACLAGNWTGATGSSGLIAQYGGICFSTGNHRRNVEEDGAADIVVANGGQINLHSTTIGGISQTKNTLTASGIIYDPR